MKILVTGAAGFIGFHLSNRLLKEGHEVVGLDVINDYYDVNLKYSRLSILGLDRDEIKDGELVHSTRNKSFSLIKISLESPETVPFIQNGKFDAVVNLAAQAGVRYSIENPMAYMQANMVGFLNILEGCRHGKVGHLVYASSSSVYGLNENMPFSIHDNVDHPVSLYAASKKSNELMAHTYSHLYNLPTTGLRFFTVYGPWGRPDMALFLFTKAIFEGNEIQVFNHGKMKRDFTYIDDIVEGVFRVTMNTAKPNTEWTGKKPDPGTSKAPFRVYNIGNNNTVELMDFITEIEKQTGKEAKKNMLPIQPGDVSATWADVQDLINDLDYKPNTSIGYGIEQFINWYKSYYDIK